jgi:hypothetical protein
MVREYAIIHKLPAKGVGDDDDYSLGLSVLWWLGDVNVQPVESRDVTSRRGGVDVAGEAVGAGHFGD